MMKLRQAALKAARERWADYILVRLVAHKEEIGEVEGANRIGMSVLAQ